MIRRVFFVITLAFWILLTPNAAVSANNSTQNSFDADDPLTFPAGRQWNLDLLPAGDIYPPYSADLHRPGFGVMNMDIMDSEIPDAGDRRYGFMLGGQYGLLRLQSASEPGAAFQVDVYGAFYGVFDADNSTDNIGWDGLYGLAFYWTNNKGLAAKLAMQHDSSHVGDEYIERTGRKRINYTREEWALGLSYRFMKNWRIYGEGAYGFDLRNTDVQEPWRIQGGMEWEADDLFLSGRGGYYAAVNIGAAEELDWEEDITLQAGIVISARRFYRQFRIGLIYRDGRSLIGEFFQDREEWWGIGLWLDL